MRMATSRHRLGAAVIAGLLVLHGCGTPQQSAAPDPSTSAGSAAPTASGAESAASGIPGAQTVTLYTCASDTTVQAVIKSFMAEHPGTSVELFRAPTGQLNARIAAICGGPVWAPT